MSAVSLFDFDTADEASVSEHGWGVPFTNKLRAVVLIRIRREALNRAKLLLPTEIPGDPRLDILADDIRQMYMVIPAVKAGPISASAFSGFIFTAPKECGGYLWQEVGPGPDAFRVLSTIGTEWNADDERRKAERHARGEYTLAEMAEAASRLQTNIARARQLMAAPTAQVDPPAVHDTADPRTTTDHRPPCPCCGGRMIVVEVFARGGAPRGPPRTYDSVRTATP